MVGLGPLFGSLERGIFAGIGAVDFAAAAIPVKRAAGCARYVKRPDFRFLGAAFGQYAKILS